MSTNVVPLRSERTINGREGKVFYQGNVFLGWVDNVEGRIVIDRADVVRTGSRGTGYKALGWNGSGTLSGFKTTSKFLLLVTQYVQTGKMPDPVAITYELSDPDAFRDGRGGEEGNPMVERVPLLQCKFWEAALGYAVDSLVRQEVPFTFEGIDTPSVIVNSQMPQF